MLANSFSYLPVKTKGGAWKLVSDVAVMQYLRSFGDEGRNNRLGQELGELVNSGAIVLLECRCVTPETAIDQVCEVLTNREARPIGYPILITQSSGDDQRLLGILTAFDLL